MITPDDKDWTWVLETACRDCGFDASTCSVGMISSLLRANAQAWFGLYERGLIHAGRPDDATWSTLEYACHVRDVFRRFKSRIELMLNVDNPLFENWDQDLSAVEDAYEQQDAEVVVDELVTAAGELADVVDTIAGDSWERQGRRSNGSLFTVESISRYMIHDPVHHIWDVSH